MEKKFKIEMRVTLDGKPESWVDMFPGCSWCHNLAKMHAENLSSPNAHADKQPRVLRIVPALS
jgi:dihydroorotate dehydrogenase